MDCRTEKDLLGKKSISTEVYWGIHTQRALDNFNISSIKTPLNLIKALVMVKKAACQANAELGYLSSNKAKAIINACDEITKGDFRNHFPLDSLQGGAGTSTNMNVNEVIANYAIEILDKQKGDYSIIHPIEDVNMHQSTNDVYPTAVKIASILALQDLSKEVAHTQGTFQRKEKAFSKIIKIGRTELQEAVPMTLGSEFAAFAEAISRDRWRIFKSEERLRTVNIGGTAIGTGLGAPRKYIFLVIEKLRNITNLGLSRAENITGDTANTDPFVEVSGMMKAHASNLIKIANDLRLLNLLGEIKLPKTQSGSSIMPGKINPVILEAVIQSSIKVIANDEIITQTTSRSSLQINEFMPLLAASLLESFEVLLNCNRLFSHHLDGISADADRCMQYLSKSETIVTAFVPHIGYEQCESLLKKFHESTNDNLRAFLAQELGSELVNQILSPFALTALGYKDKE